MDFSAFDTKKLDEYEIEIKEGKISVKFSDDAGKFYAEKTLLQLKNSGEKTL